MVRQRILFLMPVISRTVALALLLTVSLTDSDPRCVAETPYQIRYADPFDNPGGSAGFENLKAGTFAA